jgi:hypothetical protein
LVCSFVWLLGKKIMGNWRSRKLYSFHFSGEEI